MTPYRCPVCGHTVRVPAWAVVEHCTHRDTIHDAKRPAKMVEVEG